MEVEKIKIPVLIVGSGPTGMLAANLLGQMGISTLLVERNATTSDLPKAILLDDEGFRSIQAVGLSEVIREQVLMGYGARYFSPSGVCFAKIAPTLAEYGYPRRNSFLQPELERELAKGMARFGCVKARYQTTLIHLKNNSNNVQATLKGPQGEAIEVEAEFLLACDGGRSTVRDLIGIEMAGATYEQDWLVVDTLNDPDKDFFSKFICDPARPTVIVPAPKGGRRYEFMLLEGEKREDMEKHETVKRLLREYRGIDSADIIRAVVYTFHARIAEKLTDGRVVLMGDAAHLSPPFAGQGMNAGLRDAHNVAWKVALALKENAPVSILESYELERRGPIKAMIDFAVALGNIVMPANPIRGQIMEALIDILALFPEAQDYVLNMKFKPKPHYTQGLFLKENEDDVADLGGKMFPQPTVAEAEGHETLLDYLSGDGFALLGIGARCLEGLEQLQHPLWKQLNAQRILLDYELPSARSEKVKSAQFVGDDYGIMKHRGKILLIRPDRYAAGSFLPEDEEIFATRLTTLLKLS